MSSLRVELDIFEATNPTSTAQTHLSQPLGVEDGLRNDALPTAQQTACEQFHFCATFCAALNPDRIFASSNRGCLQVVLWYRLHWGVSVTARPGYVRRPHLLLLLHLTQRLCRASPASRSQRKLRFLQDTSRRRTLYHAAPHHLTTPRLHAPKSSYSIVRSRSQGGQVSVLTACNLPPPAHTTSGEVHQKQKHLTGPSSMNGQSIIVERQTSNRHCGMAATSPRQRNNATTQQQQRTNERTNERRWLCLATLSPRRLCDEGSGRRVVSVSECG